jgi:hypothetical protein
MGYDPWNFSMKLQESIETPTPKMGTHLGVWGFVPSHSPALPRAWDVTPRLPSWHALLQSLTLDTNPRLRLQQFGWMKNIRMHSSHWWIVTTSIWTYKSEAIMKGMGCLKKKINVKTTSCLKQKNKRECPSNFFTFKVIPKQIFDLWLCCKMIEESALEK